MLATATAVPATIAKANEPIQSSQSKTANESNSKVTAPEQKKRKYNIVNTMGGLDIMVNGGGYGVSPKEYGLRFGHGNGYGKTNMLRIKHNAKLKRRINK